MSLDRRALGGPGKPRGLRGRPRAVALQDRPRCRGGCQVPPDPRDRQSPVPEPAPLLGFPCIPLRAPLASPNKGRPDRETPEGRSGPRYRLGALSRGARTTRSRCRTGARLFRAEAPGRPRGAPAPESAPATALPRGPETASEPATTPRLGVNVPASPSPAAQLPRSEQNRCQRPWDGVCRRRTPTVARPAFPSGPPHLRPEPLRYLAAPDAPRRRRPAGAAPGTRGSPVPPWCRRCRRCRRCGAERGGAGWRTGEGPAGPARRKQRAVNHRAHPGDTDGPPAAAPAPEGDTVPARRTGPGASGTPRHCRARGSPRSQRRFTVRSGGRAGAAPAAPEHPGPEKRNRPRGRLYGAAPRRGAPPGRQSPGAAPYRRGVLGPLSRSHGAPAKTDGRAARGVPAVFTAVSPGAITTGRARPRHCPSLAARVRLRASDPA